MSLQANDDLRAEIKAALIAADPESHVLDFDPRVNLSPQLWRTRCIKGRSVRVWFIEGLEPVGEQRVGMMDYTIGVRIIGLRTVSDTAQHALEDATLLVLRHVKDLAACRTVRAAGTPRATQVVGRFPCYEQLVTGQFFAIVTKS